MADDLLALLPPDSDDDVPEVNQRQERINKAFHISKEGYKNELVVLSPSFFNVDPQSIVNTVNNDRWGAQNLDASIQEAYILGDYRRALELCMTYLDALHDGKISQEGGGTGRDREYYDVALRSCVRLKDYETGRLLAAQSRHLWKAYYVVGLSAANVYLFLRQPKDAISTLLASVPLKINSAPYINLLARSFRELSDDISHQNSPTSRSDIPCSTGSQARSISSLATFLEGYRDRVSMPYYHGIAGTAFAFQATGGDASSLPPKDTIEAWCRSSGFEGAELTSLLLICTSKHVGDEAGGGDEEDIQAAGKSVRTL